MLSTWEKRTGEGRLEHELVQLKLVAVVAANVLLLLQPKPLQLLLLPKPLQLLLELLLAPDVASSLG